MIPCAVRALCTLINPNYDPNDDSHIAVLNLAWQIYNALTTPQVIRKVANIFDDTSLEWNSEDRAQRLIDDLLSEAAGQYGA